MKLIEQKILSFIEAITPINKSRGNAKKIISYAFPVKKICFYTLMTESQNSDNRFFYWGKPNDGFYFLGYDILIPYNLTEPKKDKHSSNTESVKQNFISNKNEFNLDSVPLIIGGTAFPSLNKNEVWNDYSSSDWYIPKFIFLTKGDESFVIINFLSTDNFSLTIPEALNKISSLMESSSDKQSPLSISLKQSENINDDFSRWEKTIEKILQGISNNNFYKIVLSREVISTLTDTPSIARLVDNLTNKFPECYNFVFRSGSSVFFGASPEKLLKISGNVIETDALAGSIKRGKTKDEDDKYAARLLSSQKDLLEQKAVLDFIVDAVSKFTEEIEYNNRPVIKKLENIQHLWTPVKAKLKPDAPIFDIVKALHPTPAVCGVPCKKVVKFLDDNEPHYRGFYSGIIGWFNFENEGEFAVGIRSALIKENKLYAYSGCGIVQGSDAETEYEESRLKLRTIMSLFENENTNK